MEKKDRYLNADALDDTLCPTEEGYLRVVYSTDDGLGVVTPDGEKEFIEWSVAFDRYEPVWVSSQRTQL